MFGSDSNDDDSTDAETNSDDEQTTSTRRKWLKYGAGGFGLLVVGSAFSGDDDGESEASGGGSGGSSGGDSGSGSGGDSGGSSGPLEIIEHGPYEDDFSSGVRGKVKNVSGDEQGYVAVEAKFFYENERVGDGLDNTQDLGDGRVWQFDCAFLETDKQWDEYEIEASTSPF